MLCPFQHFGGLRAPEQGPFLLARIGIHQALQLGGHVLLSRHGENHGKTFGKHGENLAKMRF